MKKQILENNKLIAEFMGLTLHRNRWFNEKNQIICEGKKLQYHSSWDWLMPVVEKIEETNRYNEYYPCMVEIWKTCCKINDGNNGYTLFETINGETKIKSVYLTCVQFIKWYNMSKN